MIRVHHFFLSTRPFDQCFRLPGRPDRLRIGSRALGTGVSLPLTHASIMGRAGEANVEVSFFRPEGYAARAGCGLAQRPPASIARPVAAAIGGVLLLTDAVW